MPRLVVWDFDGTLIPFDSEQYLVETLPLPGLRRLGARLFVYGDRQGWDPGKLKRLYAWCLCGTPTAALDPICAQIARRISPPDRDGLKALAAAGIDMKVLSCGTADMSRGTLRAAGLVKAFSGVQANNLLTRDGHITGIERQIYLPETKVEIAAQYGLPWNEIVAVGDGLTDLPLLDQAERGILIATGERAARYADRGYEIVPTLSQAIAHIGNLG
jgi:phosphoserine phosphatase